MVEFEVPEIDYEQYSNRELAAVPLAVLGVALVILAASFVTTGTPVPLGIDFTGGSEVTVQTTMDEGELRDVFDEPIASVQQVENPIEGGSGTAYVIKFDTSDVDAVRQSAQDAGLRVLGSGSTSPAFGGDNQRWALIGLVVAFLGISLLAFGLFRTFVPSIAIVVSAFSDLVIPLAVLTLLGIKLSLGVVAGLLMLIGYSVDSDILLNNHILRRSGGFYESTYRAMRTGVTMTLTSIAAMAVMAVMATLFGIDIMASIGLVLVIGLTADLMNTYLLNLSLLRYYKYEGVNK